MNTPSGFAAAIAAHHAAGQKTRLNMTSDIRRASPRPSIKALARAFGEDKAPLLRRILLARGRKELLSLSTDAAALEKESYGRQDMRTLRFVALSQVLEGFGEESFRTRRGEWVTYVNMGDSYTTTILKFRGTYRVGDWGSIAEKYGDWGS